MPIQTYFELEMSTYLPIGKCKAQIVSVSIVKWIIKSKEVKVICRCLQPDRTWHKVKSPKAD